MGYKYYQPNKKDIKDNYGDCVVRALTKVMNKTWIEIFDDLIPIARELQTIPNSKPCYEKYILVNGFIYVGVSNKKGTKRPTIKSFSKEHSTGTYFINVANHVVSIVDGNYYDTWDSGSCSIYGYYIKTDV